MRIVREVMKVSSNDENLNYQFEKKNILKFYWPPRRIITFASATLALLISISCSHLEYRDEVASHLSRCSTLNFASAPVPTAYAPFSPSLAARTPLACFLIAGHKCAAGGQLSTRELPARGPIAHKHRLYRQQLTRPLTRIAC